jgi:hypothetical protein
MRRPSKPRRNHFGVVEHQDVAGREQAGQVAHAAVLQRGLGAGPHHQQPGGIARGCRSQRNALFGQFEIEQIDAHVLCAHGPMQEMAKAPLPGIFKVPASTMSPPSLAPLSRISATTLSMFGSVASMSQRSPSRKAWPTRIAASPDPWSTRSGRRP